MPNSCAPVFFSLLTLASSWYSGPNHFEPLMPKPLRFVESSVSPPLPGPPGRYCALGVVVPVPCTAVFTVYGLTAHSSL